MSRLSATLLFLLAVVLVLATGYLSRQISLPLPRNELFTIPSGESFSSMTGRLVGRDLLPMDDVLFKVLALLTGADIRAGQYQLREGMTGLEMLALFRSGRVVQHRLTFLEGWTFDQWLHTLREAPYLQVNSSAMTRDELAAALGIRGALEGKFFPDTYQYSSHDTDVALLRLAHSRMERVLEEEWRQRGADLQLGDAYNALILASIIEKETGFGPDRMKVASVFHNRLAMGMKLQSDPTVIYGLGDSIDDRAGVNLTKRHLKEDTPFNTYTRAGLPPTPICSPGRAAISAAMNGSTHPYLYFVAKGRGRSYFSTTLDEHNRAVNRYQKNPAP